MSISESDGMERFAKVECSTPASVIKFPSVEATDESDTQATIATTPAVEPTVDIHVLDLSPLKILQSAMNDTYFGPVLQNTQHERITPARIAQLLAMFDAFRFAANKHERDASWAALNQSAAMRDATAIMKAAISEISARLEKGVSTDIERDQRRSLSFFLHLLQDDCAAAIRTVDKVTRELIDPSVQTYPNYQGTLSILRDALLEEHNAVQLKKPSAQQLYLKNLHSTIDGIMATLAYKQHLTADRPMVHTQAACISAEIVILQTAAGRSIRCLSEPHNKQYRFLLVDIAATVRNLYDVLKYGVTYDRSCSCLSGTDRPSPAQRLNSLISDGQYLLNLSGETLDYSMEDVVESLVGFDGDPMGLTNKTEEIVKGLRDKLMAKQNLNCPQASIATTPAVESTVDIRDLSPLKILQNAMNDTYFGPVLQNTQHERITPARIAQLLAMFDAFRFAANKHERDAAWAALNQSAAMHDATAIMKAAISEISARLEKGVSTDIERDQRRSLSFFLHLLQGECAAAIRTVDKVTRELIDPSVQTYPNYQGTLSILRDALLEEHNAVQLKKPSAQQLYLKNLHSTIDGIMATLAYKQHLTADTHMVHTQAACISAEIVILQTTAGRVIRCLSERRNKQYRFLLVDIAAAVRNLYDVLKYGVTYDRSCSCLSGTDRPSPAQRLNSLISDGQYFLDLSGETPDYSMEDVVETLVGFDGDPMGLTNKTEEIVKGLRDKLMAKQKLNSSGTTPPNCYKGLLMHDLITAGQELLDLSGETFDYTMNDVVEGLRSHFSDNPVGLREKTQELVEGLRHKVNAKQQGMASSSTVTTTLYR